MTHSPHEQNHPLNILEEISSILTRPHDHQDMLENIVGLVRKRFEVQVCSLYLLDETRKLLILKATLGLDPTITGKLSMGIQEGLTGLVIEQMKPVAEKYAAKHSRYKFFPESGEEKYASFMGVPLVSRSKPIGVLVVQTEEAREFTKEDISALVTIASQLTGIILNAELLRSIQEKERETNSLKAELEEVQNKLDEKQDHYDKKIPFTGKPTKKKPTQNFLISGVVGSLGMGMGKAVLLKEGFDWDLIEEEKNEDADTEVQQFYDSLQESIVQVMELTNRIKDSLSAEDGAIFHAHLMVLEDRTVNRQIVEKIRQGYTAVWSVKSVINRYIQAFSEMDDAYLRERAIDMKDIGQRILGNLLGLHNNSDHWNLKENSIVVSNDLTPSQVVSLDMDRVKGFILAKGGQTSHVSILSKSFQIPALVGVGNAIHRIKENDLVIIDAKVGEAYINPLEQVSKEYSRLIQEEIAHHKALERLKDIPAISLDNQEFVLQSNVGLLSDLKVVEKYGSHGVGLFRTEFYFLSRNQLPTEKDQVEHYSNLLKALGDQPAIIRTLDIGGDKFLPYLHIPHEDNPFLGWRSIRISLDREDIFRTQLRSLFIASKYGNLQIMFPMISGMTELQKAKKIFLEEKEKVLKEGYEIAEKIPLGIMIEVPAAALLASKLIKEVDFFSIGTNDLIQYTLAVDRNNEKVAKLYDSLHPAVLSEIQMVVEAAQNEGKPLSICGEMAGDPMRILPLIGMGIRRFSMPASSIPLVKEVIRNIDTAETATITNKILKMDTCEEIKDFLGNKFKLIQKKLIH